MSGWVGRSSPLLRFVPTYIHLYGRFPRAKGWREALGGAPCTCRAVNLVGIKQLGRSLSHPSLARVTCSSPSGYASRTEYVGLCNGVGSSIGEPLSAARGLGRCLWRRRVTPALGVCIKYTYLHTDVCNRRRQRPRSFVCMCNTPVSANSTWLVRSVGRGSAP